MTGAPLPEPGLTSERMPAPFNSPPFSDPLLADRYIIEGELGRGGMATVYLAEERKHGRKVAIKVLSADLAASLGAERFLREIGIAARLAHPHIVPLIDSGEAAGLLYYVASYVPGGSLRERMDREGPLPIEDAVRIADEVGAALGFAHRSGIVHRDVKPENILFADGHALLADFGIARAFSAPESESLTASGLAMGTPDYMSPEQASGERELGSASDQYSLACVVYAMLAGQPPFGGGTAQRTIARHVTETPPSLRRHRPEVPQRIDQAIARALEKDPASRFASVAEFTAELRAGIAGEGRSRSAAARTIAVLPFVNASPDPGNEFLSDGITDELIDALAKVEGLGVAARTSVFALKGKLQDVRAIGALLDAAVVLEGTVRRSGDRLRITAQLSSTDDGRLIWSQRYERTLDDVFAIQDEIARTIVATLRATSLADLEHMVPRRYTENVRAYASYLKGRYAWNQRTEDGVKEAIQFFQEAIAEDPNYALAYTGLADAYALHVDYRSVPVEEGFSRAKSYARRALELDESLAEAHASLAWSLFIHDWDWEAAGREFRRAVELDPRYATAHQWHAFLLVSQGRLEEALIEAHTAQEIDPGSISIRRSLGWQYLYARRYDQARYHLTRAVAMNPTSEESHRVLGFGLALEGLYDDAERELREALSLPGAGSYTRAILGYTLARAGRRAEAEGLLSELERAAGQAYVSPVALATVNIGLGNAELALDWAEAAMEDRRGWLAYLRVNPLLDPLREEPRFMELVRRMKL